MEKSRLSLERKSELVILGYVDTVGDIGRDADCNCFRI